MIEFTSNYNDKEIVFKKEGIRYNNEAFIQYTDMEDIAVNEGNCIFRYKGHLIKMDFDPADTAKVEAYFIRPRDEKPVNVASDPEFDKFAYLNTPQVPVEEPPKKGSKVGLIIGAIVAVAAIALALVILL